jgi:hypothetical protein
MLSRSRTARRVVGGLSASICFPDFRTSRACTLRSSGLYTDAGRASRTFLIYLPSAAFALPRSLTVREGGGYHAVEDLGAARGSEGVLRFIVGILWIILMVFIILVILNTPGIR